LGVTRNLKIALKYLRHADNARLLWIDAICINQEDLHERAEQVGYMRDIYGYATRAMVWLGEPGENSDLGLALFEQLANESDIDLSPYDFRTLYGHTLGKSASENSAARSVHNTLSVRNTMTI
jgi:hypothetical protein